jgi:hypothetical protein
MENIINVNLHKTCNIGYPNRQYNDATVHITPKDQNSPLKEVENQPKAADSSTYRTKTNLLLSQNYGSSKKQNYQQQIDHKNSIRN